MHRSVLVRCVAAIGAGTLLRSSQALAQHASHYPPPPPGLSDSLLLNGGEIVTGMLAAVVAFQAALAYREGKLGRGMTFVAVGMVIMSLGHFIFVVRRFADFDVLGFLGENGSFIAISCAMFVSFLASAYGFWLIRRAAGVR